MIQCRWIIIGRLMALLLGLGPLLVPSIGLAQSVDQEIPIQMGFLVNIIRFSDLNNVSQPSEVITIAIEAPSDAIALYQGHLEGKVVGGHPLKVVSLESATKPIIVFFPTAAPSSRVEFPQAMTIGTDPDFLERGGVIKMGIVNKKVQFSVNQSALHRCGIGLSSRVLALAEKVIKQ